MSERDHSTSRPSCLAPACHNDALCRGLCHQCYQSVYRYVKQGAITWEKLEEEGKVLPKSKTRDRQKSIRKWVLG